MNDLLVFAEELERRDADIARALTDVELLQADVEHLRSQADATASFLDAFPELVAAREGDELAAESARTEAESRVRDADEQLERARKEDERLAAAKAQQEALDSLHAAERWVEQAQAAVVAAKAEGDERREEARRLDARAVALAPRVRNLPAPGDGLDGAIDWASRARGALLLEHSNLARERDAIVREANELAAGVLGEPMLSRAVAGLRDRLALALGEPSA